MKFSLKIIVALVLSCVAAFAQSGKPLVQSGNVTPTHVWCVTTNGIAQDCGTAAIPFATTFGTWGTGPTNCAWTALVTSGAAQKICLGGTTSGGAEIYVQNSGTAPAQPLTLDLNGTLYQFPFSGMGAGNVVGPNSSNMGDMACWNNTVGTLLSDCGGTLANFALDISKSPFNCVAGGSDQYACIQAAINAIEALSPKPAILVPAGNFFVTGGTPTLNNQYDHIIFANGAIFNSDGADVGLLKSANSDQIIEYPILAGKGGPIDSGTFGATQCTLNITGSSGTFIIGGVVTGGLHAGCNSSGQVFIGGTTFTDSFGTSNFYNTGGVAITGPGTTSLDQGSPIPGGCSRTPATGSSGAWAGTTSYACGDVVTLTYLTYTLHIIEQTAGSCTSGGSSPTPKNYLINFTDGSCTWQLENPATFYLYENAVGSTDNNIIMNVDLSSLGASYSIANTGGTSEFECFGCVLAQGAYLNAGTTATFVGGGCGVSTIAACFTFGGSWTGKFNEYGMFNVTDAPNMGSLTHSLSGNITISNSGFTDGPAISQPNGANSGTFYASGAVTLVTASGTDQIGCKLWDGTTAFASASATVVSTGVPLSLSGIITAPAGNIRISCRDYTASSNGSMEWEVSGTTKDSTVTAFRIGP